MRVGWVGLDVPQQETVNLLVHVLSEAVLVLVIPLETRI
jgi:hypothetical protein